MSAENAARLFENYIYGMTRNAVIAQCGAVPCPEAPDNALLLCAPTKVKFLELEWRESFWFNNLAQLQQVVLETSVKSMADVAEVEKKMLNAGWERGYVETGDADFDILEHYKDVDFEKMFSAMHEFEDKRKKEAGLSVYYLPDKYFRQVVGKIGSWSLAVDKAPENLVVAQLFIDALKLKMFFTAPLLSRKNALRYGEMIKRK